MATAWKDGLIEEIQDQMTVMGWIEPPAVPDNTVTKQQLFDTKRTSVRAESAVHNIQRISQWGVARGRSGPGAFAALPSYASMGEQAPVPEQWLHRPVVAFGLPGAGLPDEPAANNPYDETSNHGGFGPGLPSLPSNASILEEIGRVTGGRNTKYG